MKANSSILDKKWKTIDGQLIEFLPTFRNLVLSRDRNILIGSDSQQDGKFTEFVTVVAALKPGNGSRVFYTRDRVTQIKSLRERLTNEVWLSVTTGLELNELIPEIAELTIHIDANPNIKFKSSEYIKELTSMVLGQGFKAVLKPNSWCASCAADRVVKLKEDYQIK